MENFLFVEKYEIVFDPPKDGNCQFSAVANQLSLIGIVETPESLRFQVIDNLTKNPYALDNETHLSTFQHMSNYKSYLS